MNYCDAKTFLFFSTKVLQIIKQIKPPHFGTGGTSQSPLLFLYPSPPPALSVLHLSAPLAFPYRGIVILQKLRQSWATPDSPAKLLVWYVNSNLLLSSRLRLESDVKPTTGGWGRLRCLKSVWSQNFVTWWLLPCVCTVSAVPCSSSIFSCHLDLYWLLCNLCSSSILSSINSTCDSCSLQSESGGQDGGRASSCSLKSVVAPEPGYRFFNWNEERFCQIIGDLTLLQCHSTLIHCESAANQQSFRTGSRDTILRLSQRKIMSQQLWPK